MVIRSSAVLAAVMACSFAMSGCKQYATSGEIRTQAAGGTAGTQAAGGAAGTQAAGGAAGTQAAGGTAGIQAAGGEAARPSSGEIDNPAGTSRHEAERTAAPMPDFKDVKDAVYVQTTDGSSVRIRSSCDTGTDSNIVTYADSGTKLKRTGESGQWTRLDYEGAPAYISTSFVSLREPETTGPACACLDSGEVTLNPAWKYAGLSKINSGSAMLYRTKAEKRKNITVCVNAGHGTKGGSSVKTQCHPDGTPKVTGGTTGSGAVTAVAVSGGMTFSDGTPESKATLAMAKILKDKLLDAGYDVMMIRESDDVQLDNIARTVIANNTSNCHIALHWDATSSNKGAFFMSVPKAESYRNMEPVKSHWKQHNALGESLVAGLKGAGVKIFSNGAMEMDLTQTSYSTIPSVDIELGDKASSHTRATMETLADGLMSGINQYFGQ